MWYRGDNRGMKTVIHNECQTFTTSVLVSPLITSLSSWLGFTHGVLYQAAPVQLTNEKGLDFLKMDLGATVCYRFLYIKVSLSDPTFKESTH